MLPPQTGGRVHINDNQFFEGVPPVVRAFQVGGYQVCQKWLKDRQGRTLSFADLHHYQKIVVTLAETIRLLGEIDDRRPGRSLRGVAFGGGSMSWGRLNRKVFEAGPALWYKARETIKAHA